MKKELQKEINAIVQSAEFLAMTTWNNNSHGSGKQLRNMNARIFSIGNYKFLVSYTTLVAFCVDGKGYDIMREHYFYKEPTAYSEGYYTNYSPSTAKQISAFFKECKVDKVFTYRDI